MREETIEARIRRAREPMPDICDRTISYLADQLAAVKAELAEEHRLRLGAEQAADVANTALRYYKSHLALVISGGGNASG